MKISNLFESDVTSIQEPELNNFLSWMYLNNVPNDFPLNLHYNDKIIFSGTALELKTYIMDNWSTFNGIYRIIDNKGQTHHIITITR